MNPKYIWLTGVLQLLSIFVVGPALGAVIAYKAWKTRHEGPESGRYGTRFLASGVVGFVLFGCATWLNADVRSGLYFLRLTGVVLGGLLLGISMGYGFSAFLRIWYWHKTTRLS